MGWTLKIFIGVFALALGGVAHAQEICTGILSMAGRDFEDSRNTSYIAASLYSNNCSGSSVKSSSGNSLDVSAVIKAVPVSFGLSGRNDSEKLQNFCATYDQRSTTSTSDQLATSTVVREALTAFNECINLSRKSIFLNARLVGMEQVVVEVRRGEENSSIVGVIYNSDQMTCHLPPTAGAPSQVATKDSVLALNDNNTVPVTCERKAAETTDGGRLFDAAVLTVNTSRGGLSLVIPADTRLPLVNARELNAKIEALETRASTLEKHPTILGLLKVSEGGKTISATSGLTYAVEDGVGVVTFANPSNLVVVPVVSDFGTIPGTTYITAAHWVTSNSPTSALIRKKVLDTGDRTESPTEFSLVILGY